MRRARAIAGLASVLALATIAACGESGERPAPAARPLPTSLCGPVTYGGDGRPQLLIVNSGSLQGPFSDHGVQNAQATKMVLAQHGWRAGEFTVGLQVCDEASAGSPLPNEKKCARNAKAFGADPSVIVVLGPVTSTCARAMVPVLNSTQGGPLPIVSMGTTYLGLTRKGPGVATGDPENLYPTGTRNYARMAPADDAQAAAAALYAQGLGVQRPYVLHHDDAWGIGVATAFVTTAERLGMRIAGTRRWDRRAHSYRKLGQRIRRSGADGVYLGGYAIDNGARLVRDLRDELGPGTPILAPDGFNQPERIVEGAGDHAEGFVVTIASLPARALPPNGQRFAREFEHRFGALPCCFSVQTAEATNVALDAIARSDGSRASVLRNIFRTRVRDGLLGSFELDRYGDTTLRKVAVYRIRAGRLRYVAAISPATELLARR
jgi:branched-chain amino acid transport system substrate-binding protein